MRGVDVELENPRNMDICRCTRAPLFEAGFEVRLDGRHWPHTTSAQVKRNLTSCLRAAQRDIPAGCQSPLEV